MEEEGSQSSSGSSGSLAVPDTRGQYAREPGSQQALVLSLDQIITVGSSNEYTEGPAVAAAKPGSGQCSPQPAQRQQKPELEGGLAPQLHLQGLASRGQRQHCHSPPILAFPTQMPISGSCGSSSVEGSILRSGPCPDHVAMTTSNPSKPKQEELKWLEEGEEDNGGRSSLGGGHAHLCEYCGSCTCEECTSSRALPSCWTCQRRFMCSAQNLLEYATCVCCVKGLFYHCSSDDEDVCADRPFSCDSSRRGLRWAAIAVAAIFLPCLLCYAPAKGCLRVVQGCHRHLKGPGGCRCGRSNAVCSKNATRRSN